MDCRKVSLLHTTWSLVLAAAPAAQGRHQNLERAGATTTSTSFVFPTFNSTSGGERDHAGSSLDVLPIAIAAVLAGIAVLSLLLYLTKGRCWSKGKAQAE